MCVETAFLLCEDCKTEGGTEKQYVFKHSVGAVCYVKTKKSLYMPILH